MLLGRLWLYDWRVIYDEFTNTCTFTFNSTKIVLLPKRETMGTSSYEEISNLLSLARFDVEIVESGIVYVLIRKVGVDYGKIPIATKYLLNEFNDVFPEELLDDLPPLQDIQYQIDLVPGATLLNRPHYRISLKEHKELRR